MSNNLAIMNIAPERAREACDACRKSHKKCTYDDNSTRCLRCEKRDTPCSLFGDPTAIPQQLEPDVPPPLMVVPGPEPWVGLGTPNASSAASSNFSHTLPSPEEYYQWHVAGSAPPPGEYPAEMMFLEGTANQHGSEQPALDQDGMYGHHNVFGDDT